MKHKILTNIAEGLNEYLGKDSTFEDVRVEDVKTFLPGMVSVNRFIGMDIQTLDVAEREIGSFAPLISAYNCDVVIFTKGADYDKVEEEMDILLRRVRKYFAKDLGGLKGLEEIKDNVSEKVLTFTIDGIRTFDGKLQTGDLGHLSTLSLTIKTELAF